MAEFIFDLQRFADDTEDTTDTTETTDTTDEVVGDGDGEGSSGGSEGGDSDSSSDSDTGNNAEEDIEITSLYGVQSIKKFNSKPGWEKRIRNEGEIVFPMFMDIETADAFTIYSHDVFLTALSDNTVPYYDIQDGIADSVDFSRLLGSAVLYNDAYDTINLVDSNVGNIIEYWRENSSSLSIIFDTGAVLNFDIGQVSPWFNFANGESMIYSARQGQWLSGNEAEAEFVFWNTATTQTGTSATDTNTNVDNFAVSQAGNTAIFNAEGYDIINLYDVTSSDVSYSVSADNYTINLDSTEVTDSYITVYFPTGGALVVENSSNHSPIFNLADGTSLLLQPQPR